MKVFTTLSDWEYLPQGLALLRSMRASSTNFVIHYLCLDKSTYEVMKEEPNVCAKLLSELEKEDTLINEAYATQPSPEAFIVGNRTGLEPAWIQHCWRLVSYWANYVMLKIDPPDLVHLDNDMFFFKPWELIYKAVGEKSIGLSRNNSDNDKTNGRYCVSCVYFKNDMPGNQCLFSWRNWMLNPQNEYAKEYGHCGDQKYLELFEFLFGSENIAILDDRGLKQSAPWVVGEIKNDLVLYHFSNFRANYEEEQYYIPAARHGLKNKTNLDKTLRMLYDVYYSVCKEELNRVSKTLK